MTHYLVKYDQAGKPEIVMSGVGLDQLKKIQGVIPDIKIVSLGEYERAKRWLREHDSPAEAPEEAE